MNYQNSRGALLFLIEHHFKLFKRLYYVQKKISQMTSPAPRVAAREPIYSNSGLRIYEIMEALFF